MKFPERLNKGDTIGICAPSGGIIDEKDIKRLDYAILTLEKLGYNVIETKSVRKENRGRSTSPKERAEELKELLYDDKVKLIIFATGGDFLVEILYYLDIDKLKNIKPKWIQGYSDITTLEFVFNSILDIPSIYGQTIKNYSMNPLHQSLISPLEIASGKQIVQYSFDKYEKERKEVTNPTTPYNLTEKVEWKNVTGQNEIIIKGRAIGGCLDALKNLFGTKYDNIKGYIEKYREDGIIWFLECYEMSTSSLFCTLWQMKNASYFKNCKGIVFGRPLFIRNDYDIDFNQTVLDALGDLNIPIICDADIGHVSPQMAIVNGAILKITSKNKKGKVETYFM